MSEEFLRAKIFSFVFMLSTFRGVCIVWCCFEWQGGDGNDGGEWFGVEAKTWKRALLLFIYNYDAKKVFLINRNFNNSNPTPLLRVQETPANKQPNKINAGLKSCNQMNSFHMFLNNSVSRSLSLSPPPASFRFNLKSSKEKLQAHVVCFYLFLAVFFFWCLFICAAKRKSKRRRKEKGGRDLLLCLMLPSINLTVERCCY